MKERLLLLYILCYLCPCFGMADEDKESTHFKQQQMICKQYLDRLNLNSSNYRTILELGCDTADISKGLAQKFPDTLCIAIDCNQPAIDYAQKKHHGLQNLKILYDFAQIFDLKEHNLPLADLIACYHVIHAIKRKDLTHTFNNIAANLNIHGTVDMNTAAKTEEPSNITTAIRKTLIHSSKWHETLLESLPVVLAGDDVLTRLTVDELKTLATDAGLKVLVCEEVEQHFVYKSKEEFGYCWHGILQSYIGHMPQATQLSFIKELVDTYCSTYNQDPNRIQTSFLTIHLTAEKV